jgi:hypothetical protein
VAHTCAIWYQALGNALDFKTNEIMGMQEESGLTDIYDVIAYLRDVDSDFNIDWDDMDLCLGDMMEVRTLSTQSRCMYVCTWQM